jgi:hypothetical protein
MSDRLMDRVSIPVRQRGMLLRLCEILKVARNPPHWKLRDRSTGPTHRTNLQLYCTSHGKYLVHLLTEADVWRIRFCLLAMGRADMRRTNDGTGSK